jgi:hypothetical protein
MRKTAGVIAAALGVALPSSLAAEAPPIQVNPNRPTFATPALTTERGVVELEFGLQQLTPRQGGSVSFTPFLVKLGLLTRLELRIGGNGVLRQAPPGEPSATGFADTTLGAQWCYLRDGPLGIDQGVQFTWKLPTASAARGLGSGEPDGTLILLFSRDIGAFHVDVNVLETWLGRTHDAGGGTARQSSGTVSASRTLNDRWSLTAELYSIGPTPETPRIFSNLWSVGYKVSSRLVLDGGLDAGLSPAAQRVSLFAGLTVGVARIRRPPTP